ncbi:hypothetical protein [Hymenobacter cheonanensis]|uniref:hypothetical protein n=1 Tax=Hymenobacter sp. CA2-7 TaxID=3063993 RepID=UPI002713746F|nr:hypothetical protein [Hymenobacter sp. CA2-7]MDO7884316.1 hypothetical protein [Hymenobacter sp. CA2-7]
MSQRSRLQLGPGCLVVLGLLMGLAACKKDTETPSSPPAGRKPSADFSFAIRNPGVLPATVAFH